MRIAFMALLVLVSACGNPPDLPMGWEDAVAIDDLTQTWCGGFWGYDHSPSVSATSCHLGLRVVGNDLWFGCSEEVEGFFRRDGVLVGVLVQPAGMDPRVPPPCECYIGVEAEIPEDPPATVSLYTRSGNYEEDNRPIFIGSDEVVR